MAEACGGPVGDAVRLQARRDLQWVHGAFAQVAVAVEQPLHGVGGGTARGGRGRRLPHVSGLPTGNTSFAAAAFTKAAFTTAALTRAVFTTAVFTTAVFTNAACTRAAHTARTVPLVVPATGAIVTAVGGARPADVIRVIRVLSVLRRTHALSHLVQTVAPVGEAGP
ncbi:hypothetical protein STPH2_2682 [Streptomyces sp. KO7888]|nr:hypothetical protein [Streptomyces sp. KO7888]